MTRRASQAPLFSDSLLLCAWLIERLGSDTAIMPHTVCRTALALMEHLVLALRGFERERNIDEADQRLILLRIQLRLACATDYLDEPQVLHALGIADRIGRQLGGWQRAMEAA